jgi:hypothetical protein
MKGTRQAREIVLNGESFFKKMPKAIQSDRMRRVLGKIFVQFYQKTAKCFHPDWRCFRILYDY